MEIDEKKKEDIIREMLMASVYAAEWISTPERFCNGDKLGFEIDGVQVLANVFFDKYALRVTMTTPVKAMGYKTVYYRHHSFFSQFLKTGSLMVSDVEGEFATQECLEVARDILTGLYSDWAVLHIRVDEIRRKLSAFPEFERTYAEKEKERRCLLNRRIRDLSLKSGELKKRFKAGEISQNDYIAQKKPIHEEIVSLMSESKIQDPFQKMFAEELRQCRYAIDKASLIRSMI